MIEKKEDLEKVCESCGKIKELDELYDVDPGNGKPIKMCWLCKKNYERANKGGENWKKMIPPRRLN